MAAVALTDPSPARCYDYLLGGRDNYAADRDAAMALEAACGGAGGTLRQLARRDRLYLERAVSWVAHEGAAQFLDLGAGLPVPQPYRNTHEIAREARKDARVAYIDSDPIAVRHGALVMAGDGVAYVRADLRDVDTVLRHPEVTRVIDFTRPVGIVAAMVSYFMSGDEMREAMASYVAAMPPGSYLIVTSPVFSSERTWGQMRDAYAGAALLYGHTAEDMESFLAGTVLVPPGIDVARDTCPEPLEAGPPCVLAGIGRKP